MRALQKPRVPLGAKTQSVGRRVEVKRQLLEARVRKSPRGPVEARMWSLGRQSGARARRRAKIKGCGEAAIGRLRRRGCDL